MTCWARAALPTSCRYKVSQFPERQRRSVEVSSIRGPRPISDIVTGSVPRVSEPDSFEGRRRHRWRALSDSNARSGDGAHFRVGGRP